jgi:hypothetical protein
MHPGIQASRHPGIAAGEGRTCAITITTAGELHCWGSNLLGELGVGIEMVSAVPGSVFGP